MSIFLKEKHPKCDGGNIHILCYLLNETQLQKYQSGSENKLFQSSDIIFTSTKKTIDQIFKKWRNEMNGKVLLIHLSQCFHLKFPEKMKKP